MSAIQEKIRAFLQSYGDRFALGAAVFLFAAVLVGAPLLTPDMDSAVDDLARFQRQIQEATRKPYSAGPHERIPPEAVSSRLEDYPFPKAPDLRLLVSKGATAEGEVDLAEGMAQDIDFATELDQFKVGSIRVLDAEGRPTTVVVARAVGDTAVRFSADALPGRTDWTGSFEITRAGPGTVAVSGRIRVRKVHEKPKLLELPRVTGVEEADPAVLGKLRVAWSAAALSASASAPVRYLVERCEGEIASDAAFVPVTAEPVAGLSFEDAGDGVLPGRKYHYRVRAVIPADVVVRDEQRALAPDPAWKRWGTVTTASPSVSLQVPAGFMFRCDAMPGFGNQRALFTVWVWDGAARAWRTRRNVVVDRGMKIGLYDDDKTLVHDATLMVATVYGDKRELRLKGTAPESRFDDIAKQDVVYRLMRVPVMLLADMQAYEGPLPDEEERASEGASGQAGGEKEDEAAWKATCRALQERVRAFEALVSGRKWQEAENQVVSIERDLQKAEEQADTARRAQISGLRRQFEGKVDRMRKAKEREAEEREEAAREFERKKEDLGFK